MRADTGWGVGSHVTLKVQQHAEERENIERLGGGGR